MRAHFHILPSTSRVLPTATMNDKLVPVQMVEYEGSVATLSEVTLFGVVIRKSVVAPRGDK